MLAFFLFKSLFNHCQKMLRGAGEMAFPPAPSIQNFSPPVYLLHFYITLLSFLLSFLKISPLPLASDGPFSHFPALLMFLHKYTYIKNQKLNITYERGYLIQYIFSPFHFTENFIISFCHGCIKSHFLYVPYFHYSFFS